MQAAVVVALTLLAFISASIQERLTILCCVHIDVSFSEGVDEILDLVALSKNDGEPLLLMILQGWTRLHCDGSESEAQMARPEAF